MSNNVVWDDTVPGPPPVSPTASHRSHRSAGSSFSAIDQSPRAAKRKKLISQDILTDDQINLVLADLDAEEQATLLGAGLGKQTWSRYLVANYFSKYKWYNPNRDNPDAPSLSKGWAYFEHFTLPRRFDEQSGGHDIRAPPGVAKGTKLYNVFMTPQESLSDWGIGMGMYFSTLSATFIILVLAGCLNIYNIIYYGSDEYDNGPGVKIFLLSMLKYSAVCTAREWVVCAEPDGADTCTNNIKIWDDIFTKQYYGTAKDSNTGEEVTLINRTTCLPAQFTQGMINYGTLLLLILAMAVFMRYLSKKEVRFDEDNTSAPDYSIVVRNPPPDAIDPDEWRDFFDTFSDKAVTVCTVALNNEQLLAKLVQRRKDIQTLKRRFSLGIEVDFDDEQSMDTAVENAKRYRQGEEAQRNCLSKLLSCIFTPLSQCLGFGLHETVIWKRIKATTEEIQKLQQKEYKCASVYVTFETEQGQRTALEALNASELEVITNTAMNLDSSVLFQGRVLRVEEACEPNAVRWADLDYFTLSIYLRQLIMLGITIGLVLLSAFILFISRLRVGTIFFSIILSTFNSIIPIVVRLLVSYEKHYDEGSMQKSLYVKITVFRWVNTAIITRVITPLLVTIGQEKIDLINTVNAMMISEMIVSPLLRYLDFMTIINRHYFAPRAKTEEELFSCFSGGWYNLAERFTDYTKVLLLCTFYSAFYPLMYFLGAGILFAQYWMDKFLLLRSWQKAPFVGPETSRFSRTYFNSLAILLGAMSSAYAYFKSPFTMLCSCAENNKECALPDTQEFTNVELNSGTIIPEVLTSNEGFYFCNQDIDHFPPVPVGQGSDKWMTDSQEQLSRIYGWTCVVLLILYIVVVLGQRTLRAVISLVSGVYEPRGCNQHKDFSSGIGIETFGYIPQLEVPGFSFPLLICNIDDIDVRLIGWKDPNCQNEVDEHRNYDNQNLIFDVPYVALHRSRNVTVDESNMPRRERKVRPIFSVVKHYPPEWARRARENHQS